MNPERLKAALRAAVADADRPGATIVVGYGLCSNAVLGLKTKYATLVVPRVDDCIAMMLGSNEAFAAESAKAPGTYYVAKAYLEECDTILSEHEKLVEKRGCERAEKMMRLLLANYTRIALIDTGRYDLAPYRAGWPSSRRGSIWPSKRCRARRGYSTSWWPALGRRLRRRPSRPRAHPARLSAGPVAGRRLTQTSSSPARRWGGPRVGRAAGRARGAGAPCAPAPRGLTATVPLVSSGDAQQLLGGGDCLDGVLGVAVGADLVGPGAGRGRAADHDLHAARADRRP